MSWTKEQREAVKRHLSGWIETEPLVEAILDTMEQQKADVDFRFALRDAKELWLEFLERELLGGLSHSLIRLVDNGEIEAMKRELEKESDENEI